MWWPFWKWRPVEIFQCWESILDIIIYLHMKFRWNRTMLNLWGIVAAILKMASARNFSMSGINSGHHNLPTYEMSVKSDNVEFVRYCGGQFEYIFWKKLLNGLKLRAFEKYYYILVKYKMPYYYSSMVIRYIFYCVQSAWS